MPKILRPGLMVVIAAILALASLAEARSLYKAGDHHDHTDHSGVICACMLPAGAEDHDDLLPVDRLACPDAACAVQGWSAFSLGSGGLRATDGLPPSRAPPRFS